jgi:hypothetical protein
MRSVGLGLLSGLLAGCTTVSAPAAVRPTLIAVEALGYHCDTGVADNVPSGLTQWKCSGSVAESRASVDVDGNETGVTGLTLDINSVDPEMSRLEFRRLASAVPPLSAQVGLSTALDTWTGTQDPTHVGGIRVNGLCDATQCIVFIGFVEGPPQPSNVQ